MQSLRSCGFILGLMAAVFTAQALAAEQEASKKPTKPVSRVEQLAPLLDENTLVVFRMDVKRIEGAEAFDVLARLFPPPGGFTDKDAVRKQMQERWKELADRGGETLYLVLRIAPGVDDGIIGAIPLMPGVDPAPLLDWLKYLDGQERHRTEDLVWTTGPKTAAAINSRQASPRPDFTEAFASLADAPLQWTMALPDDPRRVLASFIPELSTELGGESLRQIATDTKWIAVSGQLGEQARLRIDVRLSNAERAQQLSDLLLRLRSVLPTLPAVQQAVPAADAFFRRQNPQRMEQHVSLEFSAADSRLLVNQVLAEQLRIWAERKANKTESPDER
ncbi:MAG: hypothetical protein U0939_07535 [Pirellulales bacterium]